MAAHKKHNIEVYNFIMFTNIRTIILTHVIAIEITNSSCIQLSYVYIFTVVQAFTFRIFSIVHPNLLPLLGISTSKIFSSIILFSQIHSNLPVVIRKGE